MYHGKIFGKSFAFVSADTKSTFAHEAEDAGARTGLKTAGFGWEVINLHNNGVDLYAEVLRNVTFRWLDLDASYMITSVPASPNFAEVLFTMSISKEKPKFSPPPQLYESLPSVTDFRELEVHNPNSLKMVGGGKLVEGSLVRLILKSWVPVDGSGSQDHRHIFLPLGLRVEKGDYIVFHADHAGTEVDFEVQGVIAYEV